jgi:hypothetical protein
VDNRLSLKPTLIEILFDAPGVRRTRFTESVGLVVQASLNQRQRLQQLFFPEGIAFDGKEFVRTGVTANAFTYLTAARTSVGTT